MNSKKLSILLKLSTLPILTITSQAAVIIPTVDNATVVPNIGNTARLTSGTQLYDSSNTGTATLTTISNGDLLATVQAAYSEWDSDGHNSGFSIAESNSGQYIVWDLGADMTLNNAVLWKYGNAGGSAPHAMDEFRFQYNTSAEGATTFAGTTTVFNLGLPTSGTKTTLGTQDTQAPDTFALGGSTVRFVKMTLISNHPAGTASSIAFNEIVFDAVAVPEPSSTALLGLGGLALILRRRR